MANVVPIFVAPVPSLLHKKKIGIPMQEFQISEWN
jgi:hypothetical protein